MSSRSRRSLRPSGDFIRDAQGQRSLSVLVAGFMVLLVAYASLYPFEGWRWPTGADWANAWALPWPRWRDRADEWLNLLGYVPVGLVVTVALLRRGLNPLWALALGVALPALLSYSMELLQTLLPRRVPSLKDWVGNTVGAALGAACAWALQASGWLRRLRLARDRWFAGESAGALVLLLLWPAALLAPATLPFGLGQCWDEIETGFLWFLGQLPLSAWGLDLSLEPAALATLSTERSAPSTPAQILAIALGGLSPVALCCAALSPGLQRLVPMTAMAALALVAMSLSTALNFGPVHALSWLTAGALVACLLCIPLALPFVWLPRRWCAALALLVLAVGVVLGAQMPMGAYYAQNLQAWEQGRFIRFHGLALWVAWLWPYLAMAWLMRRLARPDRASP